MKREETKDEERKMERERENEKKTSERRKGRRKEQVKWKSLIWRGGGERVEVEILEGMKWGKNKGREAGENGGREKTGNREVVANQNGTETNAYIMLSQNPFQNLIYYLVLVGGKKQEGNYFLVDFTLDLDLKV